MDSWSEDLDPATGRVIAQVGVSSKALVDEAVESARATHESWKRTKPADRARLLRRVSELIRRDGDKLARLESLDTGKPLRQAKADVEVAARYFEFYSDTVSTFGGQAIPLGDEFVAYTRREPLGVTAHIIPWNYPLQIGSRTTAPALAVGNCCVLKPAEEAPLTLLQLGLLLLEAGLPPGALNVVPGDGESTGAALARHPGIDHLSFTGSVEVGRLVSAAAAGNVVPTTLELGGKSPNIVFPDANIDDAVPIIVNSIIQNAGQTCSAGSRLLVHRKVRDRVVQAIVERFQKLRIGPGLDDPDMGPLISEGQLQRVQAHVTRGIQQGRLVVGGSRATEDGLQAGYFFKPTVIDEVALDSFLAREEVFGPVVAVLPFDSPEEAVAIANSTDFGLIAAVWTSDVSIAHWMAQEVRAGQIYINTYGAGGGVEVPFGGFKHSGYGREKGAEALFGYTQTKAIVAKLAVNR